ncbi:flavin reductase [Nocardia sp. NBC_00403]|uniref:flavin reductase n=1 Tax=Nocardia sp. NBC_00403 TaxID=2975990 RepID=UPI002E25113F
MHREATARHERDTTGEVAHDHPKPTAMLGRDQLSLAALFGTETGNDIGTFAYCDWHPGPAGLPILDAAAGWFCGRILERHDFGDHVGLLVAPRSRVRLAPATARYPSYDLDTKRRHRRAGRRRAG